MAKLLAGLRRLIVELQAAAWGLFALLLDAVGDLGAWGAGLTALTVAACALVAARLMQRCLVREISAAPSRRVRFVDQEKWFFLPAWLILPFVLVGRLGRALGRLLVRLVRRSRGGDGPEAPAGAGEPTAPPAYLAASLGPSFLLAAAATAGLYLLTRLADPLLAARLGLAPGLSAWEYLLLGKRPEMLAHLPLTRSAPHLATLLLFLLWTTVWWWTARIVRALHWRQLGGDLHAVRDVATVLPSWRRWGAAHQLVAPAPPYRQWAGTLVVCAAPLALWAWTSLASVPYRVGAADLAVAAVVLLGWAVHLALRGDERLASEESEQPDDEADVQPGWPEVAADLEETLQIATPWPFREPRPIARPAWSAGEVVDDALLSPLLGELIPLRDGQRRLLSFQRDELHRLTRLGHVFSRAETTRGVLVLGGDDGSETLEVRERNRVLLAPEGSGKTTLAILAAANHTLLHTRSSLLVVRDERAAGALHERIHHAVDRSTLRWNLRPRRVGDDLVADLSRGIVPDLVVTSLERLVTVMLHQIDAYAPLLGNLGLVIVDDVESFAGSIEIHAQLAFQRLTLAARKLLGVAQLGEAAAPLVLALGCESMHQMGTWTGSLVGIDAEVERLAADASGGDDGEASGGDDGEASAAATDRQLFYRLSDFEAATGERLGIGELIACCERQGVAWHYRHAVDGRRHLGRSTLFLADEPVCFTTDPSAAAVVLLAGSHTEVGREIERLAHAGARHPRQPVAFVTCIDPDVEMALTQRDDRLSLAAHLAALPRPVLRPPTGLTLGSHLAADLSQTWTEVADVLQTFGNTTAHKLRQLAAEGLLLCERRTDVRRASNEYEEKLYVRALAAAVPETGERRDDEALLPPRVAQVELTAEGSIEIRDRIDRDLIARVDADSAGLAYYPGRVFADARGRFVVVHHAAREGGEDDGSAPGRDGEDDTRPAILVEPVLGDEVSTPRRRLRIEAVLASGDPRAKRQQRPAEARRRGPRFEPGTVDPSITGHAFYGPDPLRIGELPVEVELALVGLHGRHYATHLLGPTFCEVRQRRRFTSRPGHGDDAWETRLTTVALCVYPNPAEAEDPQRNLRLRSARLVAAALRAVLPSVYRGAEESLGVALHLDDDDPAPDHLLAPWECFVLFDLHALGNGSARAVFRDGVELLLRLARLLLERVLTHDRLLALHDHWAGPDGGGDLYGGTETAAGDPRYPRLRAQQRRSAEEEVRHEALRWLDSRLRPEGDATSAAGGLAVHLAEAEPGEGDVIDVGRCWHAPGRSVANLLWVKNRWRTFDGRELMLDAALDRPLVEEARRLRPDSPRLNALRQRHRDLLADPGQALPDGTVHGAPRAVWRVEGEARKPHSSQPGAGDPELLAEHETLAVYAAHAWPALGPLARKLHAESEALDPADPLAAHRLAGLLASLVQAMPVERTAAGTPLSASLVSPLDVLLHRRGDTTSKALLLATLLAACGLPSGLFRSRDERRTVAAAALPAPLALEVTTVTHHRDARGRYASEEDAVGEAETYARGSAAGREMDAHLVAWSRRVDLPAPPALWSELPPPPPAAAEEASESDPEPTTGQATLLYVPIEANVRRLPGSITTGRPESWVFLPLTGLASHLGDEPPGDDAREAEALER